MNRLQRMSDWWRTRDTRERAMLAVMFAMLGGFVVWYGVIAPLRHLRDNAQARYDRAAAQLTVAEAAAHEIASLLRRQPARPAGEALTRLVLDSATAAGVPVSRQRADPQGALEIGIDAVTATVLFAWLDTLRREHGLAPHTVGITEANGRLRVELSFRAGAA